MKKNIYYLSLILIIYFFVISCGSYFNPKYYYYNKNKAKNDDSNGESIDIGGGGDGLSPEEDPFVNYEGKRPWNDPNYRFTMNFDEMVIQASFDGNNRPTYKLVKGSWSLGDAQKNEYLYNGPDTSAAGNNVSSVVYYSYRGKNPTFNPNSGYNKSSRLNRFYFYRFTGKALSIVSLNNYLIAIDTYSKLVFAFAVPSYWGSIVGNAIPEKWGAVENGWEAKYAVNTQDVFGNIDGIQYFYEYDPVGIVKENGEIEVFQWCLDSIGNNNKYAPRVEGNKIDLNREIAKEGFAGRSPYMPIKIEETTKDIITIAAKSLKNISAKSKAGYLNWGRPTYPNSTLDFGYFAYAIAGNAYDMDIPSDIVNIEELYPNGVSAIEASTLDYNKLKIDIQNYKSFSSYKTYEIKNIKSKEVYIDLAANIYKYNTLKASFFGTYLDTDNLGKGGSGIIAEKTSPILKLKYSSSKDAFVIDSSSIESSTDTKIIYPKDFILERGRTKDITIKYKWMKGNDTTNGEEVEVTYTLKFESEK